MALVCPDCHRALAASNRQCTACSTVYDEVDGILDFMGEVPMDFSVERYQHLVDLEDEHFWFSGRRQLLTNLIRKNLSSGQKLAELGCGSGWLFRAQPDLRGAAVDGHFEGLVGLRQEFGEYLTLARCDVTKTALVSDQYSMVVAFDVMEHVDEEDFLTEASRLLKTGGKLILSVPACPWLWSELDEAAGHRKRYTSSTLKDALGKAGFGISYLTRYQCILFPVFVLSRWFGWQKRERTVPNPLVNFILKMVNRLDGFLGSLFSLPWGSSLVVVGEKRK